MTVYRGVDGARAVMLWGRVLWLTPKDIAALGEWGNELRDAKQKDIEHERAWRLRDEAEDEAIMRGLMARWKIT